MRGDGQQEWKFWKTRYSHETGSISFTFNTHDCSDFDVSAGDRAAFAAELRLMAEAVDPADAADEPGTTLHPNHDHSNPNELGFDFENAWEAINEYVVACGGDPTSLVTDKAREIAIRDVETTFCTDLQIFLGEVRARAEREGCDELDDDAPLLARVDELETDVLELHNKIGNVELQRLNQASLTALIARVEYLEQSVNLLRPIGNER